jgi:hypothetical protein
MPHSGHEHDDSRKTAGVLPNRDKAPAFKQPLHIAAGGKFAQDLYPLRPAPKIRHNLPAELLIEPQGLQETRPKNH